MIKFSVLGPAVGKARPRATTVGGKARVYTPAKSVKYESLVAVNAFAAMRGLDPLTCPIEAEIWVMHEIPASWPKKRKDAAVNGDAVPMSKPDLDNVAKAILDACNGIIYQDDKQVTDLIIRRRFSIGEPGVICYFKEKIL